jgi:hypothetical protein
MRGNMIISGRYACKHGVHVGVRRKIVFICKDSVHVASVYRVPNVCLPCVYRVPKDSIHMQTQCSYNVCLHIHV